ncbi:hypothetical protein Angca_003679 [Angiostrongylus cantonensis]|nr:hypothetical protein Angca_003679 [Angiostrongylus cantonensis]
MPSFVFRLCKVFINLDAIIGARFFTWVITGKQLISTLNRVPHMLFSLVHFVLIFSFTQLACAVPNANHSPQTLKDLDGGGFSDPKKILSRRKRALDGIEGRGFGFDKRKRALDELEGAGLGFDKRALNSLEGEGFGFEKRALNALDGTGFGFDKRALNTLEGEGFGFDKRALNSLDGEGFGFEKRALNSLEGEGFGFDKRALNSLEGEGFGFDKRAHKSLERGGFDSGKKFYRHYLSTHPLLRFYRSRQAAQGRSRLL